MKLKTLAIAVALASVSVTASAESVLKISGDIGVGYMKNSGSDATIGQFGSEINFDASETVNGTTFAGHLGLQYGSSNTVTTNDDGDRVSGSATLNEARIDISNARMGSFRLGNLGDNGCGLVQVGGDFKIHRGHTQGGCSGEAGNGIRWNKTIGPASVAISHILKSQGSGGKAETAIGVAGTVGPASASIGYVDGNAAVKGLAMGLAGKIGPVEAHFRYNKLSASGSKGVHGINLKYTTGNGIAIYGGTQTSSAAAGMDKTMSFGVEKTIGATELFIEANDDGSASNATGYTIGARHTF